jgi:hypothetical protein
VTRTVITIAGRPWAVRLAIWAAANDGGRRFVSVDLLATP